MPEFVGDGVLIAGDAAMMCINLGYMVRGMDYAVASGQMAAQASIRAIDREDTSKKGLEHYRELLESSFVMQDLRQFSNVPQFMAGFDRMFGVYPEMIRDIMNSLFVIDGAPVRPMKKTLRPIVKGVGTMNIARDGLGALKAL